MTFCSDYFRAAFDGSFVEATNKKVELHGVKQEVLENFHAWLYTRALVSDDGKKLEYQPLIKLWIFGDRFQVPMLQNCVINEIFAKERRGDLPEPLTVKSAYEDTVEGSPLRRLMIDVLAYTSFLGNEDGSLMTARYREHFTIEILQDLVKELYHARQRDMIVRRRRPQRDECFYHVHGKDEHC